MLQKAVYYHEKALPGVLQVNLIRREAMPAVSIRVITEKRIHDLYFPNTENKNL